MFLLNVLFKNSLSLSLRLSLFIYLVFIFRELSITSRTKVFKTGQKLEVCKDIMDEAKSLLGQNKKDPEPSTILDVATSPQKKIVSVKGVVYKVK